MGYQKHKNIITGFDAGNAINDEHSSITYAALSGILEQVDSFFENYKKNEMDCVGVCMQNSVLQAVVILYLMAEEINFFLYSSNSVTDKSIPFFCDTILTADTDGLNVMASLSLQPNPGFVKEQAVQPAGAGYVFFASSGSSGPAKYVCYKGSNLINNAKKCVNRFSFHAASRVLVTVPVNHMYGLGAGLLPALIAGAAVRLIEKNNVIKLFTHIAAFKPHTTLITPAITKMILILNKDLSGCRRYITAGEKTDAHTHRNFESRYGTLINLYGCTELGAIATSLPGDVHAESRVMGAVYPLEGVQIMINEGLYSEILVQHDAGFEGYVNREGKIVLPEFTSEGYYRTKDAGNETRQNGFIVSGRIDNCVNRSGFIVSLDEVEAKLKSLFDNFRQVIVFEGESVNGVTPRLMAMCEITDELIPDEKLVKATCNSNMGRYAVPEEFIFVQEMPRLHNGKADRLFIKKNYSTIKRII